MKKQFLQLSLVACLGIPAAAIAQNIFPTNGNVGVGTVSPLNKLTVRKALGSDDYVSFQHSYQFEVQSGLGSSGSRSMGIGLLDNGKGVIQVKEFNVGYNDVLLNPVSGNVGIGTGAPEARLTVQGNAVIRKPMGSSVWVDLAAQQRIYGLDGFLDIGVFDNASSFMQANRYNVGTQLLLLNPVGGNVGIGTTTPQAKLDVAGKVNCTVLELTSDRNQKQEVQAISVAEVLAKVVQLPVSSWAYTNSPGVRHVGPMAQDFKAAFSLGEDDKHIGAGDGIGVALAAIQGLHQIVQEKDSEIAALKRELAGLKQELASVKDSVTDRLAALEQAVSKRNVQQASFRPEATR